MHLHRDRPTRCPLHGPVMSLVSKWQGQTPGKVYCFRLYFRSCYRDVCTCFRTTIFKPTQRGLSESHCSMPLQDANKPSRKQILAAEREAHGAYDPDRLANLLPRILRIEKPSSKHASQNYAFRFTSRSHLRRRDNVLTGRENVRDGEANAASTATTSETRVNGMPLAPTWADSGSPRSPPSPTDDDPVPATVPQINYGDARPSRQPPSSPLDATMPNDTSTMQPNRTLTAADTSSGSNGESTEDGVSHSTTGLLAGGMVAAVLFLVALGIWISWYRHRSDRSAWKKRTKSHRLGSIDGLRGVSTDAQSATTAETLENKAGSSDFLVKHSVPPGKAGPFDRAVANILSHTSRAQSQPLRVDSIPGGGDSSTASYLDVPGASLSHSRSLDSIEEVAEPATGVSSHFDMAKRDSALSFVEMTPLRTTWTDRLHRPTTSPGDSTRAFGSSPTSVSFSTPDSRLNKKSSPRRPQSAKNGGEIEMTRQGSNLVIRQRPSTGTLRRPLSSAGSSFRSALRKTRGGEEDDGAICIETDGIVDRDDANKGLYELTIANSVHNTKLGSHFSSSTLQTAQMRTSYATMADSPSGSFSFEIKDAVRLGAPLTLEPRPTGPCSADPKAAVRVAEVKEERQPPATMSSKDTFVNDLDWNLQDCCWTTDSNIISVRSAITNASARDQAQPVNHES